MKHRQRVGVSILLYALVLAACYAPSGVDKPRSPLPTASAEATTAILPSPSPTRAPVQLVVLHTNDNWGETEPCG